VCGSELRKRLKSPTELSGQEAVKKIAFGIDESRIETDCPDGCSQLKGSSDAAKALLRGFTDQSNWSRLRNGLGMIVWTPTDR
jgi:hypothetical protein